MHEKAAPELAAFLVNACEWRTLVKRDDNTALRCGSKPQNSEQPQHFAVCPLVAEAIIAAVDAMTEAELDEAYAKIPKWQIELFDRMFGGGEK